MRDALSNIYIYCLAGGFSPEQAQSGFTEIESQQWNIVGKMVHTEFYSDCGSSSTIIPYASR